MARPRVAAACFILPQKLFLSVIPLFLEKGSSSAHRCEPTSCLVYILCVTAGRRSDLF